MRDLIPSSEMKVWDQYTMNEKGISSFQLMEIASSVFSYRFMHLFPNRNQSICIIVGPGSNGGDGLAVARILYVNGYRNINVYGHFESLDMGLYNDMKKNYKLLKCFSGVKWIESHKELQDYYAANIVTTIDAVFGIGLNRIVGPEWETIFTTVNALSHLIISIDMPSGLQADIETDPPAEHSIISADHTFTFQTYKRAMTFPETGKYCGKVHVLDIGLSKKFTSQSSGNFKLLDESIWNVLDQNMTFDHKGINGKTLHFCGSEKMPGAAILCSRAAHRSGAGYVISLAPENNVDLMMLHHPEALPLSYKPSDGLFIDKSYFEIPGLTSILAGPGLGTSDFVKNSIHQLIHLRLNIPLILDADALNVLASHPELLSGWKGHLVITPHAKEFDKLFGFSENWFEREKKARLESAKLDICIILKGAFTRIAFPDGSLYINTSGNPGLAKAGSGDVLSGILSAHLCRYKDFKHAVLSAVFLHGRIAEDLTETVSEKSILATDLIEQIGKSIKLLEANA